jgi:hypothetical protein
LVDLFEINFGVISLYVVVDICYDWQNEHDTSDDKNGCPSYKINSVKGERFCSNKTLFL